MWYTKRSTGRSVYLQFGAIRTMSDEHGEPLFCGKDVAVALGYGNSREALRKHVEQEDVTKRDTPTAGGTQQMQYVNESGLYSLILSSKLESARRFKHWVTADSMCGRSSRHEKSSRFAQANEMQACLRFLSERSQSKKVINHQ